MPYEVKGDLNCWIWTGRTDRTGCPIIRTREGFKMARRVYWERENGLIPEGLILYSRCREGPCVNPLHLEPVSWTDWCYRVGRSKLDRRRAALVVLMRDRGHSLREIGEAFSVDPETVRSVLNGSHWTTRKATV